MERSDCAGGAGATRRNYYGPIQARGTAVRRLTSSRGVGWLSMKLEIELPTGRGGKRRGKQGDKVVFAAGYLEEGREKYLSFENFFLLTDINAD